MVVRIGSGADRMSHGDTFQQYGFLLASLQYCRHSIAFDWITGVQICKDTAFHAYPHIICFGRISLWSEKNQLR